MEGLQPEILVVLLYIFLLYEVISGIQRRGQQTLEKTRKVSMRTGKPSRVKDRIISARPPARMNDSSHHQTYRHFVQMRILARD